MTVEAPASPTSALDSDGALRVLVVDDEHLLTDLLGMALALEGWEVRSAADGDAAIAAVHDFEPDAVVLDFMLPGLDGPGVIRSLRDEGIETPVLMLTARDSIDDRMAAYAAGGDDYLTKPFALDEVVERVRGLIRHRIV